MRFDIVTLFPDMVRDSASHGVTGRAIERGIVDLSVWDPRDFTQDRYRTVDDRPYGGGPGMVMKFEPLRDAIRAAKQAQGGAAKTVYLSPQGRVLDQKAVVEFSHAQGLILVAGRYEGIDERLIEAEVDEVALPQRGDEVGQREGQRGPVGHDVGDARVRPDAAHPEDRGRQLRVERHVDHGQAAEVVGRFADDLAKYGLDKSAFSVTAKLNTGGERTVVLGAKVDDGQVPWVTFTDPELAHVGLTEEQARAKHGRIEREPPPRLHARKARNRGLTQTFLERNIVAQFREIVIPPGDRGNSEFGFHGAIPVANCITADLPVL